MERSVLLLTAGAVCLGILAWRTLATWWRWRGQRLVRCPETQEPVAIAVGAGHLALRTLVGERRIEIGECSRWPERRCCEQECLTQLEQAPDDCRVRTIVNRWYHGAICAFCGHAIGPIHWGTHNPGLVGPDLITYQWNQVRPAELPRVLETHAPICWNCYIIETVRRNHPELVTDRPPKEQVATSGERWRVAPAGRRGSDLEAAQPQ